MSHDYLMKLTFATIKVDFVFQLHIWVMRRENKKYYAMLFGLFEVWRRFKEVIGCLLPSPSQSLLELEGKVLWVDPAKDIEKFFERKLLF